MLMVPGPVIWVCGTSSLLCAGCRTILHHLVETPAESPLLELAQASVVFILSGFLFGMVVYISHTFHPWLDDFAGSTMVSAHILAHSSQGLFHRAIAQSGSVFSVSHWKSPAEVAQHFFVHLGKQLSRSSVSIRC